MEELRIAEEISNAIHKAYQELSPITTSKIIVKISPRLMKLFPEDDDSFIQICNLLIMKEEWIIFQFVTTAIKLRGSVYQLEYFPTYQNWLFSYTDGWGACDILCYRVLNPMIERYPALFHTVCKWAYEEKVYVRRASAVCLINSTAYSFAVNVPFAYVKSICDILMSDKHLHVQKGIGWLLKYAYLTYPVEIEVYLKENLSNLSRTTFRYALEKMDRDKREYFMGL